MQMDKTDPLTNSSMAAPVAILGVPFDSVTTAETIDIIARMIESGRPHYLATANVDFLVRASRVLGNRLPERVAGSDIVPLLLKDAADKGYRVYFLGAEPEVCAQAVAKVREQFPNIQIVGHDSPPFKPLMEMDHEGIIRRIKAA